MQKDITNGQEGPHFSVALDAENYPAWEEIEAGRFMPRRVRGSCQGRALG
ncbi:MAG TPA: hypothetical protein VNH11_14490 [Pirellulales bacterium]|nr:hypothetical protein [Pirellulales bacterium]